MGRWDDRLSVNALSSRSFNLAEDLELYRRLGVDRVTLHLPKLLAHGLERALGVLASSGLRIDGILPGCAFDLADPGSWPEVCATTTLALDVAHHLGAPILQITGGRAMGLTFEQAAARLFRALEPVLEHARRHGTVVAFEPVRPQFAHVGFVHALRDAATVADPLGLHLVLDTAHLWWEPQVVEQVRAVAPRCAVLQIADLALDRPVLERLVPGDGRVPIADLVGAAAAGGFDGPFELELIGSAIDAEGYEAAIARSLERVGALLAGLPQGAPDAGHR